MTPPDRITERGHSSAAYGRSWVTISTVTSRPTQDLGEFAAAGRVEVGRRLVEHQDLRVHRQHRRHRDPAALPEATGGAAAGRRASAMPTAVERARRPARSSSAPRRPRLAGPNATSSRTVGMNSWSSGSWKTMPTRRRISRRFVLGRPAARRPRPCRARRVQDAVEVQHERGLAGAVRAEQRDPLAPRDVRSTPYSACVAVGVGVGQPAHVQSDGTSTVTDGAVTSLSPVMPGPALGRDGGRHRQSRGQCPLRGGRARIVPMGRHPRRCIRGCTIAR